MHMQIKKKCPKWDCVHGFYSVLKPAKDGYGFSWQDVPCPICGGTGEVDMEEEP
jgi:hypothetical protein